MNPPEGSIAPEVSPAPAVDDTQPQQGIDPTENSDGTPKLPDADATQDPSKQKEDGEESQENGSSKKGEMPTNDAQKQFNEIIEGWKEDRVLLDKSVKENRELKEQLSSLKSRLEKYESSGEEEGEDDTDLTPSQREQKIIERYESEKQRKLAEQKNDAEREVAFKYQTDPYFRANKEGVLNVAVKFDTQNLEQAIKIHKAQQAVIEKSKAQAKKQEQKPKPPISQSRPADTENLSFADLYRRGGIN